MTAITIAALVLIWFVKPMWDRAGRMALVAFVGGTLAYSLQFTGLSGMNASTAVLIVQLEVVFVALDRRRQPWKRTWNNRVMDVDGR